MQLPQDVDPDRARQFAAEVVRELRTAGFEALWAGGCVRDQLMGRTPVDYDVATSARPEQVRELFGFRRTLAVGEAFGVIVVLGPRRAGQVQVATFRLDADYSDGRHPDRVTYTTAEADAQRRDFTINGLFFDPLTETVHDYVGGREDLQLGLIRAIGDPHQRIHEDKLRMLRAVRFAATLEFQIARETLQAVRDHAAEIRAVSGERIADEMRRLLVHPRRRAGVELLAQSGLLAAIFPDADRLGIDRAAVFPLPDVDWQCTLQILDGLEQPSFAVALAALVRGIVHHAADSAATAREVCRGWRLSNEETDGAWGCLQQESLLRAAHDRPWPTLQRALLDPRIEEHLCFAAAVARVVDGTIRHIDFCRAQRARPAAEWNPVPLIDGQDLRQLGIPPGPVYRELLELVRDQQLLGKIADRHQAISLATETWQARSRR